MSCLDPPLTAVPPGMWLCPKCKVSTIPGSKIAVHSCSKAPCKRTQHCCILHDASVCPPCCMLLRFVWSCCARFETGQTLCLQLPTFLLFRDRRSVAQQCWSRLHTPLSLLGPGTRVKHGLLRDRKSYRLYPSHNALPVPTLL